MKSVQIRSYFWSVSGHFSCSVNEKVSATNLELNIPSSYFIIWTFAKSNHHFIYRVPLESFNQMSKVYLHYLTDIVIFYLSKNHLNLTIWRKNLVNISCSVIVIFQIMLRNHARPTEVTWNWIHFGVLLRTWKIAPKTLFFFHVFGRLSGLFLLSLIPMQKKNEFFLS